MTIDRRSKLIRLAQTLRGLGCATDTVNAYCNGEFPFLSRKNTITLSTGFGLKYLSGQNLSNPELGPNGVGKSTLWDAVTYCLYGVSVRGLRASELVSWGDIGAIFVETHWLIDNQPAVVTRLGSPNRLLMGNSAETVEPTEQINIDRLIGLSRARFMQSVVYGQFAPLFIDLSGPERGALLDEVLDLGLWLKAAETASKRHTELSREVDEFGKQIAYIEGKIAGAEFT